MLTILKLVALNMSANVEKFKLQRLLREARDNKSTVLRIAGFEHELGKSVLLNSQQVQQLVDFIQSSAFLEEMCFYDTGLTLDGLQYLVDALRAHEGVKKLALESEQLGNDGAKILAAGLPPSLVSIRVICCNLGSEGENALMEAIGKRATITDVDLSSNPLGDSFLSGVQFPRSIVTLKLAGCGIADNDCVASLFGSQFFQPTACKHEYQQQKRQEEDAFGGGQDSCRRA